jgi:cell division protein FtsW (lipid II flippase)
MNTLLLTLGAGASLFLFGYGIKRWFDYKTIQGKEESNSTVKKAIGALLIGFLALVGLAPLIADLAVQFLNTIPGIKLNSTQSSEIIGAFAFLALSVSIVLIIYVYYRNRHRMYLAKEKSPAKSDDTKSTKIINSKNVISNSEISAKGNVHIGDENISKQQIINNGNIEKQINIGKNEGDINL